MLHCKVLIILKYGISPLYICLSIFLFSPLNIGLLIYFISIFLRLYCQKNININFAKKALIICILLSLVLLVIGTLNNILLYSNLLCLLNIPYILYALLWLIYILNLFYDCKISINDKFFIGVSIIYILFDIIYNKFYWTVITRILPILCAIPYFYNYSKIKKGEK